MTDTDVQATKHAPMHVSIIGKYLQLLPSTIIMKLFIVQFDYL